jgi:hypothetical protein
MSENTGWTIFGVSLVCLAAFAIFMGCEYSSSQNAQHHEEAIHQMDINTELAKRCLDNDGVWVAGACVYPHQPKAKP